ncbi:MAG: acetyl-CoA carboxylase biotin carboxyl carrier protein [Gemmatimonadota bacterium]
MDMEWLRRLVELVDESEIDTLEVSRFATRVRISKSPPVHLVNGAGVMPAEAGEGIVPGPGGSGSDGQGSAGGAGPLSAAATEALLEEAGAALHEVKSPMVGTFYRAPAPDAPPYVEVGDEVRKGQTLCILEAMKLMNELESELSGAIREVCVENAEPVEFGQVLFRIEPNEGG